MYSEEANLDEAVVEGVTRIGNKLLSNDGYHPTLLTSEVRYILKATQLLKNRLEEHLSGTTTTDNKI